MTKPLFLLLLCLSTLAFSQSNTEVFLFDLKTDNDVFELSNMKNISNNEGYDNQPSFMNNKTILYAGTRNGQTDIVMYDITLGTKTWISSTEGGEYSPLKIPDQSAVSAIRLDPDGKQLLYHYDLKNNKNSTLIENLVVGYHNWYAPTTVMSAVLETDYLSLYKTDTSKKENHKLQQNIGRSIHNMPGSKLVSYISKEKDSIWEIKSIDPISGTTKLIIETLPLSEDMCWLSDQTILMAKGGTLYKFNPKSDESWTLAVSLLDYNLTNITRLAISPDGTKLAVVAELMNQPLEPKLENIKWIAGNWKGEAFGGQTEENWSEPSGGSMMATFKLINDGKVSFYEIEIIREVENTLILQLKHFDNDLKGWESKDETVDFPLKEITATRVVFEGMSFEKVSDNEMNVYVDIHQDNGSVRTVEFNYKK
ncbi:DUF6265 family protein [Subsaxibacter sp. CAU 1640]|uniref:DUF6265 family protein n=1 Tax=Subsaxibacter sp. CAU 1640 TaxID=2933271 RepID=UPI00200338EE|nr:DUF6265 family protein [Subsaxibacter sp. CAU 1640]MCK7589979.1 DUF6265 family protein [Subsaxibacter sp. CAU 1640]